MAGLRSKPRISIKGARKVHRDASLFIIACEGEKTEAQYLNFSFLLNSRVKLLVIPSESGKSAPKHILDNLKACATDLDLKQEDQLWLVADVDRWPYETQLKAIMNKKIGKLPVNIALSNPCFELFLYLHFSEMPANEIKDPETMEAMLRKILGEYSKNNLEESTYSPYVTKAIEESEKTTYGTNLLPVNPGTDVGKLIKAILDMKPKREMKMDCPRTS